MVFENRGPFRTYFAHHTLQENDNSWPLSIKNGCGQFLTEMNLVRYGFAITVAIFAVTIGGVTVVGVEWDLLVP